VADADEEIDRPDIDEFGRPVRRVVVTDVAIPFWTMVGLLVQVGLAAIPAILIIALALKVLGFATEWLAALPTAK
jgi:hypothetical protein